MRTVATFVMAASILAVSAAAEEQSDSVAYGGTEFDTSFEVTQARLRAEGFQEVRMINADPYRLGAFDTEGSEVQLLINPQTGEVDETVYRYDMDK